MPPASLSTFAVMNPGPMTARSSASRTFHDLNEAIDFVFIEWGLAGVTQHRDHVVRRDDAGKALMLVDNGERDKVVFVEQARDFVVGSVGDAGDGIFAQVQERRRRG